MVDAMPEHRNLLLPASNFLKGPTAPTLEEVVLRLRQEKMDRFRFFLRAREYERTKELQANRP